MGLSSAGRTGGAFGDLDGDLDLDLFTVSWSGDHQRVFVNTGSGNFRDRTPLSVSGAKKRGFNAHIVDFDDDGDNDVLQTSDFGQSVLWRNEGGWTFTVHDEGDLGIATDENGMGACIGDYDNDGDFDWFVSSIYSDVSLGDPVGETGNRLYRNNNDGTWTDVTEESGTRDGGWGWAAVFADLDNDGHQDIVHTNGWMWDVFFDDLVRVFHSNGDGTFDDVASGSGLWDDGQGRGLVAFDYDHDGLIDIGINNRDDGMGLWRNVTSGSGNWLEISLQGTTSNSYGIGAVMRVRKAPGDASGVNIQPQHRLMEAPSHFQSQSPPKSWVGLGGLQLVDVKVEWPSGLVEGFDDIATNQRIVLVEGTGVPK